MSVHIGEKIRKRAKELRIGPTELGRMVHTSKQNVTGIYKRRSIDAEMLKALSKALQFNFFEYYQQPSVVKEPPAEYKKGTRFSPSELQQELDELKKHIREKDKEIMKLQKKLIDLMDKRK